MLNGVRMKALIVTFDLKAHPRRERPSSQWAPQLVAAGQQSSSQAVTLARPLGVGNNVTSNNLDALLSRVRFWDNKARDSSVAWVGGQEAILRKTRAVMSEAWKYRR